MVGNSNSGGPRPKVRDDDRRGARPGTTTIPGYVAPHGGGGGMIGQAAHVYDAEIAARVQELARTHTLDQIGIKLDISPWTIKKYYHRAFKLGELEVTGAIASKLIQKALSGKSDRLMTFYMVTKGGWNKTVQLSGPEGGPIRHTNFDFSAFLAGKSEDELTALLPLVDALLAATGNSATPGSADGLEGPDYSGAGRYADGEDEE